MCLYVSTIYIQFVAGLPSGWPPVRWRWTCLIQLIRFAYIDINAKHMATWRFAKDTTTCNVYGSVNGFHRPPSEVYVYTCVHAYGCVVLVFIWSVLFVHSAHNQFWYIIAVFANISADYCNRKLTYLKTFVWLWFIVCINIKFTPMPFPNRNSCPFRPYPHPNGCRTTVASPSPRWSPDRDRRHPRALTSSFVGLAGGHGFQ